MEAMEEEAKIVAFWEVCTWVTILEKRQFLGTIVLRGSKYSTNLLLQHGGS